MSSFMKMRIHCWFLIFVLIAKEALALSFDTEERPIQNYVVSQLVEAVKAKDRIVIVQSKIPSSWMAAPQDEPPEISIFDAHLLGFGFNSVSPVEFLKGNIVTRVNGCAFIYPLFHFTSTSIRKDPHVWYRPDMTSDTLCRLVFVHPQQEPLKDWLFDEPSTLSDPYCEQFVADAKTLSSAEFLAKYKLGQVFSNSVYEATPGCMFIVDHPQCAVTDEKLNALRGMVRDIFLSPQEVSEIVYLAYLHEDAKGGALKYAEAVQQSKILQPIPAKAKFNTLIGQHLHAALSDPEFGMAEKRAQEEKEKQQRELAERRTKLRAEVNTRLDALEKAKPVTADDFIQFEAVFVQFSLLPPEGQWASWNLERTEIRLRQFKLLMENDHETLGQELWLHAHDAWTRITVTLEDPHIQVNCVKQYDDILRKVQELPLNPKQVKEVEEAVAEMEANRKKYAK